MDRRYGNSSNLLSVGYNAYTGVLEISFHNGHVYQYFHVPAPLYSDLMQAPSHGRFFNFFIRDHYPFRRIL
ncbi:MAG TPA: KTSC domain-containing protein [Adhaeribacter sp.]|nr:KTSC domain-containing protein [Adhaeribacter sp.]